MSKPEVGKRYKIEFPSGKQLNVKVKEIIDYPASGMPSDYVLEPDKGQEEIMDNSSIYPLFPLPESLLNQTKFTEIKESKTPLCKYWTDNTSASEVLFLKQLSSYIDNITINRVIKHVEKHKEFSRDLINTNQSLLPLFGDTDKDRGVAEKIKKELDQQIELRDNNSLENIIKVLRVIANKCGNDTLIQDIV